MPHANDAFLLTFCRRKLDSHLHRPPKNTKKKQIARSAPASGRAAAPCAARAAQTASLSAQINRLALGSVQWARAIKAVSASSARNVSSRAAAVSAVAEGKPFTKVGISFFVFNSHLESNDRVFCRVAAKRRDNKSRLRGRRLNAEKFGCRRSSSSRLFYFLPFFSTSTSQSLLFSLQPLNRSSSPTAARSPSASSAPAGARHRHRRRLLRGRRATALHVQLADEAVCIGPAPSAESYLTRPSSSPRP